MDQLSRFRRSLARDARQHRGAAMTRTDSRDAAAGGSTSEHTRVLAAAIAPELGEVPFPRPGDDVYIGTPARVARIRAVVAFTRSWTSLELTSFDVETDEHMVVRILPFPSGLSGSRLWTQDRRAAR